MNWRYKKKPKLRQVSQWKWEPPPECHESQAHIRTKERYCSQINAYTGIWKPHVKLPHDFHAKAWTEYVYPQSALNRGAAYTRSTAAMLDRPPTREAAIAAGDPPYFIFDVAVESTIGLLYVIEVVKTNSVPQHKKDFLASIGVPLLIVPADPYVPHSRNTRALTDGQREERAMESEWQRYLYELRDAVRVRCGLEPMKPFMSFEQSRDLWEYENLR